MQTVQRKPRLLWDRTLFALAFMVSGAVRPFNPLLRIGIKEVQPEANLMSFNALLSKGKVYLQWKVKKEASECVYVVERSVDNSSFVPLGIREGFPSCFSLRYSFVDKLPQDQFRAEYRLQKISSDGKVRVFRPEFPAPDVSV